MKLNGKSPSIEEISVTITVPDARPEPGYKLIIDCEEPAAESLEVPVSFFVDVPEAKI